MTLVSSFCVFSNCVGKSLKKNLLNETKKQISENFFSAKLSFLNWYQNSFFFERKVTLTIKLAKIRVGSQLTGLTQIVQHGPTDFGNKVKIPFACESQMTEVNF